MGRKQAWYERNLFSWTSRLAASIVLTVVAAMKHDLRWLLVLAWLLSIVAASSIAKAVGKRRYLLTLLVAVMTGGGFLKLYFWLEPEKVTVQPRHVAFDASEERENFLFTVGNRAENDLYSVQLKLKLSDGSLFDDFSYDIPTTSRRPIIDGSEFADITGLRCIDSRGRSLAIFWMCRVDGGGKREITVMHRGKSVANIDATVSYFTNTPQPRLDDPTRAKAAFRADEPMKCNAALSFWLHPSRPPRLVRVTAEVNKGGHGQNSGIGRQLSIFVSGGSRPSCRSAIRSRMLDFRVLPGARI
jgi:hypothetical protein